MKIILYLLRLLRIIPLEYPAHLQQARRAEYIRQVEAWKERVS